MRLTKDQITQFFASKVWEEMESRIKAEIEKADAAVESPDPFSHGVAVGERRMARVTLSYKDILLKELEGDVYGHKTNVRKNDGR